MALLEVKGIKKSFGKTNVLKGIDFELEKGQVLSIIGSSGSGKTTLLRCINFLEFADEGTITVNGDTVYDGEKRCCSTAGISFRSAKRRSRRSGGTISALCFRISIFFRSTAC